MPPWTWAKQLRGACLRLSVAKRISIRHAAGATFSLHAAIPWRSADTEKKNRREVRTTAPQIAGLCSSKTGFRRKNGDFEALSTLERNSHIKRKIITAKIEKHLLPKNLSHFHVAMTIRFTTWSCKTQKFYACSCRQQLGILTQPSECDLQTVNAKHTSTASSNKRKVLEPSVSLRVQSELNFTLQRRRVRPRARARLFFTAAEARLTGKNNIFFAIFNIQVASMICENETFLRGVRQIPKIEDVKTKLSCDASLELQELKVWRQTFRAKHPSDSHNATCNDMSWKQQFQ